MNTRTLLLLPALLLFAGCPGSIDTHEEAIEETVSIMNDMCDILEKIESKKDAEAAKGDLEKLKKRMDEVEKAMEKLEAPEEATPEAMMKLQEPMAKVMQRLQKQGMRIMSNPEIAAVLDSVMSGLGR